MARRFFSPPDKQWTRVERQSSRPSVLTIRSICESAGIKVKKNNPVKLIGGERWKTLTFPPKSTNQIQFFKSWSNHSFGRLVVFVPHLKLVFFREKGANEWLVMEWNPRVGAAEDGRHWLNCYSWNVMDRSWATSPAPAAVRQGHRCAFFFVRFFFSFHQFSFAHSAAQK